MTTNRLDEPYGILLNREEPRTFQFDGHTIIGFRGDTLASALAANDIWWHGRAAVSGRPRGLFSQAQDYVPSNVDLNGDLGIDPQTQPLMDGLDASRLQTRRSCRGWSDVFRRAWSKLTVCGQHLSEPGRNWTRPREYGFSRFDAARPIDRRWSHRAHATDVAVVGGGPAGVAAAIEAARLGRKVTLIDALPVLGGGLNFERLNVSGEAAEGCALALAEEMTELEANITILLGAECHEIVPGRRLTFETEGTQVSLAAENIILATGASQRFGIFENNDLPGIMCASSAAKLIWLYGVRPGRKAVVVADSGDGFGLARDLLEAGVKVQAVLGPQCHVQSGPRRDAVVGRGVEVGYGYGVRAAHVSDGGRHIGAVTIEYLNRSGQSQAKPVELDCDLLCIASTPVPNLELPMKAGARLRYSPAASALTLFDIPDGIGLAGAAGGRFRSVGAAVTRRILLDARGNVVSIIELIALGEDVALLMASHCALAAARRHVAALAERLGVAAEIEDLSRELAVFGMSGPNAPIIAQNLSITDLTGEGGPLPDTGREAISISVTDTELLGEPGFLISMPQAAAERVWIHFASMGAEYGFGPIGRSALEILRLEKGLLCPYRDIDARTNFAEIADIAGASAPEAPAIELARHGAWNWRGLERRLVGVSGVDPHVQVRPGDLVMDRDVISGYVTSIAYSPTIGRSVGLAYVAPGQAVYGEAVMTAAEGSGHSALRVTPTPFYDPRRCQ